jgi:type IV pilus assembly protein PilN
MVRINLLPVREKLRNAEFVRVVTIATVVVVGAIAIVSCVSIGLSLHAKGLNQSKVAKQKELAALRESNKEITELKKEITNLSQQVKTIKKLTQERETPAVLMALLDQATPESVWLESFEKRNRSFVLDGYGTDTMVVANYVKKLNSFHEIRNVKIISLTNTKGTTVRFKIVGSLS